MSIHRAAFSMYALRAALRAAFQAAFQAAFRTAVMAVIMGAFVSVLFAQVLPAKTPLAAELDAYLQAYHTVSPYSGFQAVVADATGPLWAKAYGVTAPGGHRSMTVDTPSAVGSITKSFTAAAVMLLAERGIIDLDAPAVRYLPWFRTADKDASDRITIRMLLANSSGIASADRFVMDADESDGAMERGVRDLARSPTVREPGASFEYANENWSVLGVIIEKVSGLPYRVFMEKEIFAPLGMARTTTDPARFDALGVLYGQYWGPDGAYPSERRVVAMGYACGSELRSTARDMGAYLAFHLSGGRATNGFRLLSERSVAAMATGRAAIAGKSVDLGGSGKDERYGFGLVVSEIDGRTLVNHGGNRGNMSAYLAWDQATGFGVCLLFPADSADQYRFPLREKLANDLLHIAAGQPQTDYGIVTRKDPAREGAFIETSPEVAAALVGQYRDMTGQKARIYEESGRILAEIDGGLLQGRMAVRARANDRFMAENPHGAVTGFFSRGADGRAVSVSYEGMTFYRVQNERRGTKTAAPGGAFSFISPDGLEWSWSGGSITDGDNTGGGLSAGLTGHARSGAIVFSVSRDSGGAQRYNAAATADWLADSFGLNVWLENVETAADGRLRFIAVDRRGFIVELEAPAGELSLAVGSAARRLMDSIESD